MVIYLVNRCYDYDGNLTYKYNSLVGIYDNYDLARSDLIQKLKKLDDDDYQIEHNDDDYFFVRLNTSGSYLCYEISEKKMNYNELSRITIRKKKPHNLKYETLINAQILINFIVYVYMYCLCCLCVLCVMYCFYKLIYHLVNDKLIILS